MGYVAFTNSIDALIMGRKTFETILGFDIPWPYQKPVFVWSTQLKEIPDSHKENVYLVKGTPTEIVAHVHNKGYESIYIDGGTTITNFLKEDLIDEMILTTLPILLGGGSSLFSELPNELKFDLIKTKTFLNQITQSHYKRRK